MSVVRIARLEAGGKKGGEEEKEERRTPRALVPLSSEVREEERGEEVYREVVAPVAGGVLRAGWRELRPRSPQPAVGQQVQQVLQPRQPPQPQQQAPQAMPGVTPSSASMVRSAPVPGPAELSSDERSVGEAFIRYLYTEVWRLGFPPSGGRGFVYKKVSAGSEVHDCVCYARDWPTGCREVCYCPRSKTLISIPCGAAEAGSAMVVRRVSDAELDVALGRRTSWEQIVAAERAKEEAARRAMEEVRRRQEEVERIVREKLGQSSFLQGMSETQRRAWEETIVSALKSMIGPETARQLSPDELVSLALRGD